MTNTSHLIEGYEKLMLDGYGPMKGKRRKK